MSGGGGNGILSVAIVDLPERLFPVNHTAAPLPVEQALNVVKGKQSQVCEGAQSRAQARLWKIPHPRRSKTVPNKSTEEKSGQQQCTIEI
eukprot:2555522-Rhodomonas_salina.2